MTEPSEPIAATPRRPADLYEKERHYATVGMLASKWAAFEIFIDIFTLELGRLPRNIGLCLTAQVIGPSRKFDAYIAVANEREISERDRKDLLKIRTDALELGERRNRAIHDPWTIVDGIPERMEITARRALNAGAVKVSTKSIGALIDEIDKCQNRFKALHRKLLADGGT